MVDYEVEYNNRARVPEHAEIFARWREAAAAYREHMKAEENAELGVLLRLHVFAIGRSRLTPARENFRVLGNTRPVVVLDFVVDHSLSRLAIGTLEDCRKRRKHEGLCPQLCPQPQSGLMTARYESQRHAYPDNLA